MVGCLVLGILRVGLANDGWIGRNVLNLCISKLRIGASKRPENRDKKGFTP